MELTKSNRRNFVGIDPGVSGAIASISMDRNNVPHILVVKMPETAKGISELIDLWASSNAVVICEAVHSSPQMGVSTSFKFGRNFGVLEGILSNYEDVEFVTPQKWQAALNSRTGGDKKISQARAKELFPDVKGITLSNADSLLLAYYGYLKHGK